MSVVLLIMIDISRQIFSLIKKFTLASNECIWLVTGASQGYAFVEYETEKEMRYAYEVCGMVIMVTYCLCGF